MSRLRCPYCKKDTTESVQGNDEWDETRFEMDCHECGKRIDVRVEVEEYIYNLSKVARAKDDE